MKKMGFYKCPAKRCMLHTYAKEGRKFSSTVTGEEFPITTRIDCKSTWIIFLITCNRCKQEYVGKTETSLYTRISNTRSEIHSFNSSYHKVLPYTIHFNQPNHSINDVLIMGIEAIHTKSRQTILHRESFWIRKLHTLNPEEVKGEPQTRHQTASSR